jgi:uncharacterized protein (TIGR03083 family)
MDIIDATVDELHARIALAHDRFARALAAAPADLQVGRWTAADVGAHVVTVINRYTAFRPDRLANSPRGVDEINDRELEALRGQPPDALIATLADEMQRFHQQWGTDLVFPLDMPIPFHAGTIDVQAGLTNALGELLIHGRDLAIASGGEWPIEDRDAALLCGLGALILPAYVRATNRATLDVGVQVDGVTPWRLVIDGPNAESVLDDDGPADFVLEGRAEGLALLAYGRADWRAAQDLGLRASGPIPELADALTRLFEEP